MSDTRAVSSAPFGLGWAFALGRWSRDVVCCWTFGVGLLGAVLYWMAVPPLDLGFLGWVAPVPWILLIRRRQLDGRRPYTSLLLVNFIFWMAAIHWLRLPHPATAIGWVALAGYQAFYLPIFVALGRVAVHRLRVSVVLAAPILWMAIELARGHVLTGFTMGALGHTQYKWIALIQVADVVGSYGVAFVVMAVAACLGRMLPCEGQRPAWWPILPGTALVGACLAYGYWRMDVPQQPPAATIALIQGSIDIELKNDPGRSAQVFRSYMSLSQQAVRPGYPSAPGSPGAPGLPGHPGGKVDLIVWPETMFRTRLYTYDASPAVPPEYDGPPEQFLPDLRENAQNGLDSLEFVARRLGTNLLLGVDAAHCGRDGLRLYNSAAFVDRTGALLDRYDKIHRVMFGEYVPYADQFPWLQRLTPLPESLCAGNGGKAFELNGLWLSPNICYETVLPHVIRRQLLDAARDGHEPDVLVNLTNDGWFWGSSELDMHLICGVFRAVEFRKPLVIAANTGLSAWIDGNGSILAQGRRRTDEVIFAEVAPDSRRSAYLAYGDVPSYICLALACVPAVVGAADWLRRRRERKSHKAAEDVT